MESREKLHNAFCRVAQILYASKGTDDLCGNAAGLIVSELNFPRCMVILKDGGGGLRISALAGLERSKSLEFLHMRCPEDSDAFIHHVLINKTTITVDSLPASIRVAGEKTRAVVSPLFCKGKGVGALIAEAGSIGEDAFRLVDSIAKCLSVGIENHTLYTERMEGHMDTVHEVETMNLIYEIGKEVLSNLKTEEIVETAIQMIRRVIPCDGAAVAFLDEDSNAFSVTASWGSGFEKGKTLGRTDAPFHSILESGKALYRHDITLDFGEYPELLAWASEKHVISYFCVPLSFRERYFGVLILSSVRAAWFTKVHIATAGRIAVQVGIALENARLLEGIEEIFIGTARSLVSAIDAKSTWTKGHSLRVADIAVKMAGALRFSREAVERLQLAAILHDIGKIGTYEAILDKPGKLTEEEIKLIRRHPSQGAEILSPLRAMKDIIPIMKHHHERYDGTGYPDGLSGDDIPFEARILAIADVFDAMRSDRPYRKRLTDGEAVEELKKGSGTQFDPMLVGLFLDILRESQM